MGYCGGTTPDPTYHAISDYTEAYRITYDERLWNLDAILDKFFRDHTPMPIAFGGRQYRSAIFCSEEQLEEVAAYKERLAATWSPAAHTAVESVGDFYLAEEYHQDFLEKQTSRFA